MSSELWESFVCTFTTSIDKNLRAIVLLLAPAVGPPTLPPPPSQTGFKQIGYHYTIAHLIALTKTCVPSSSFLRQLLGQPTTTVLGFIPPSPQVWILVKGIIILKRNSNPDPGEQFHGNTNCDA